MNTQAYDEHTQAICSDFMTIKEASAWASEYLNKNVTVSNISYLIQYGRVKKYEINGNVHIDRKELKIYYGTYNGKRELEWKRKLGDDLDWHLSFDYLKEADTTKHVHRIHPYKGKFIPQLVEYFLDSHTDEFKTEVCFKEDDIVLDPFCGSGTTLVQANELGMNAIGIDISVFNCLISNVKTGKYDFFELNNTAKKITSELKEFVRKSKIAGFENELTGELSKFNTRFFPSHEFKYRVRRNQIDEKTYGKEKEIEFKKIFNSIVDKHKIQIIQDKSNRFLDKWYIKSVREEIEFLNESINAINNENIQNVMRIILSRTMRSGRATTHADLATLKEPVYSIYYCKKHGKVCKPLFSILGWWERYVKDTILRLYKFNGLRTGTFQLCLNGDARNIDIFGEIEKADADFAELVKNRKINGIFSSPPYVGLIDYHEQHAYAYELFQLGRKDNMEIGPLFKGQGANAKKSYIEGISGVLNNVKRFLVPDYDVFLVANDKYNLYPEIADKAGMKIYKRYKRPVLNRTEKDKSAYSEIIFHLKEND
jgi:hypothetical protein